MVVESLVFRPTWGGLRHGLFTLELRLGPEGPSFSPVELVGRIYEAAAQYPTGNLITIRDYVGNNDPAEVMELASSLADSFEVTAEVGGYAKPGWLAMSRRIRVLVSDDPWLMFRADEIFYAPENSEEMHTPNVGPANVQALRYVLVGKGANGEKVLNCLRESAIPWMVLARPLWSLEVRIL